MSQINYVQQIKLFMEFGKRNRLTSYERMFWIALFQAANDLALKNPNREWPDDFFPVSNSEMYDWSGLEERNIRAIRNRFTQMGLIDFKKGNGKKADPEYRIFYLQFNGYKIVPGSAGDEDGTGRKNVPESVRGSVGGSVGDSVGDSVTDSVGDFDGPGCKFVPDSVGDQAPEALIFNGFEPSKNKRKEKDKEKDKEKEREGARGRGFGGGFLDLSGDMGYEGGGFVPLPWDEGVRV